MDEFLDLLHESEVRRLADIRRFPGSRRHPHFAADSLSRTLPDAQIAYRHFETLGGRRSSRPNSPHTTWRVAGFRSYADHMETEEFRQGLTELLAWKGEGETAVVCAEAFFMKCHRQLLSDALLVRGYDVIHIEGPGRTRPHRMTPFARMEGERLIYDGGTMQMELPERDQTP